MGLRANYQGIFRFYDKNRSKRLFYGLFVPFA